MTIEEAFLLISEHKNISTLQYQEAVIKVLKQLNDDYIPISYMKYVDMAIESLKFQQKYKAKVQKCIERLVKRAEYFDMFYDDSGIRGCIDIINEELGGKGQ